MDNYLPFVSLDVWTMIFTWINLVILFLLLKKFLFKPVNKVLDERAAEIENEYTAAEKAHAEADNIRAEYESKIESAKTEADTIIKSAVTAANERSDAIVGEANTEARRIIEKSQKQLEQDKKNAMHEMRGEIASIAHDAAEKILKREIDEQTDNEIISEIIDKL
ncbi:MAG: F0F1 ATP synthase subunit B [Clostridia bacterium]|nr:F0F1 ATP synthase subunit B [Clostridia bacterium]MBQ3462765.1 F0F1 ATP synthase subunit B [Clostridia bacterium]MBQ3471910.1 F0F1 ATP synthase subunit B [Clostridia bacterium]MBR0469927.1 F0F1 ATP synthase subunit B [Clostridia bacterium]